VGVYDTNRRSVYLMQQRIKKHPWLEVFDGADPNAATAQRPLNTTPIQALFAMNDQLVHRLSTACAERLLEQGADDPARIRQLCWITFGREPSGEELTVCAQYLEDCRAALAGQQPATNSQETTAWASLVRVLWGSNEFVFVD
jgi:hypothetical protein